MTTEGQDYNITAIRDLLAAAFMDSRDLRRFCQSQHDFRPVLQLVNEGAGLQGHVDVLIGYCETRLLFEELLAGVYQLNPRQYARFAPMLGDSAPMIDRERHPRYHSTPLQADGVSVRRDHPAAQSPSTGPHQLVQQSAPGTEVSPDDGRWAGWSEYLRFALLVVCCIVVLFVGLIAASFVTVRLSIEAGAVLYVVVLVLGVAMAVWLVKKLIAIIRRSRSP